MTKMHKTKSAKLNQGTISVIANQLIMNVYTETRRISQTYGKAKSKLDEPTVQPFTSYNTARFLSPRNESRKIVFMSNCFKQITSDQYDVQT